MAEATDAQMQAYANQRIRVRAEQARALYNALVDDSAAITDIYDRADGGAPWNDAREDGPPTLLDSNDVLTYNSVNVLLRACITNTVPGGMTAAQVLEQLAANWPVFQSACVRPVLDN